jgi:ABC-type glutathione transport system ATPase component
MTLVILTGASGSGKTTIARAFSNLYPTLAETCFFDSIGAPTPDEMISEFGSGEEWQRMKTVAWLSEINTRLASRAILFEG